LNAAVDPLNLSPIATREELAREIEGKVAGWGAWVVYTRPNECGNCINIENKKIGEVVMMLYISL